jgi:hypothetical protein
VGLGRPTDEFISVGLLSSGLKVFNSSGADVVGGTQSSAIVHSVPRDISTISTTDLGNYVPNHERDLVHGVVSRDDATMTMTMTEHLGSKRCLARTDMRGNVVSRTWDDGLGSRRTTTGETLGFTVDTDLGVIAPNIHEDDAAIALALASPDKALDLNGSGLCTRVVMDTSRLNAANNPLTLATYSADVEGYLSFADSDTADTDYNVRFKIFALDAAGKIIGTNASEDCQNIGTAPFSIRFSGSISSSTVPIARIAVMLTDTRGELTTDLVAAQLSTFKVTGYEETSDIPARAIHVTVLEGLNQSATLNINSFAVLSGIPDASNVFISPSASGSPEVYDVNAVNMFLMSVSRVMPRAFTISGHSSFSRTLTAMYGGAGVDVAFKAMSFRDVTSAVAKAGRLAKATASEVGPILKELEPIMRMIGTAASMAPGPIGTAGRMMSSGVNMLGGN